jgi:ribosomal protein S18 acetylase RimI-like enzyme
MQPDLDSFLRTDPRDVGCEQALAVLHTYVDLVLDGQAPEALFPGVAAHLRACGPCNEDYEGLLEAAGAMASQDAPLIVEPHEGDRAQLRALFEEAEDSAEQLDGYIDAGTVLVARVGDEIVGHLQLHDGEILNMAVAAHCRGHGIGRALVEHAVALTRGEGRALVTVATATADIGNLRFYQRCGFRLRSIERDAFTPATGYPPDLEADGIPVRDRVWLDLTL